MDARGASDEVIAAGFGCAHEPTPALHRLHERYIPAGEQLKLTPHPCTKKNNNE
jgi:hypothetical protein